MTSPCNYLVSTRGVSGRIRLQSETGRSTSLHGFSGPFPTPSSVPGTDLTLEAFQVPFGMVGLPDNRCRQHDSNRAATETFMIGPEARPFVILQRNPASQSLKNSIVHDGWVDAASSPPGNISSSKSTEFAALQGLNGSDSNCEAKMLRDVNVALHELSYLGPHAVRAARPATPYPVCAVPDRMFVAELCRTCTTHPAEVTPGLSPSGQDSAHAAHCILPAHVVPSRRHGAAP
jgi:hypothetical protein